MKKKLYLSVLTFSLIIFISSVIFAAGKKVEKFPEPERDYFEIYTPGTEEVIDYTKYGEFQN